MVAEYELDSKIFKKENLDICYFITGKKFLNGILHYKLKSGSSQEIYLSEFALKENFVSENKMCEQSKNSVSRLFTRIISKGYQTGKSTMQSKIKENDMTSFLRNIFILNVKKSMFYKKI